MPGRREGDPQRLLQGRRRPEQPRRPQGALGGGPPRPREAGQLIQVVDNMPFHPECVRLGQTLAQQAPRLLIIVLELGQLAQPAEGADPPDFVANLLMQGQALLRQDRGAGVIALGLRNDG